MRETTLHIVFIVLAIFATSCGKKQELRHSDSAQVEAISDPNIYKSTVMVVLPGGEGICTGTFISPRAVLTAAHCTLKSGRYQIISNFGTASTYTAPKLGPGVVNDPKDVSILVFSTDVAKRSKNQVSLVGNATIQAGEKISIVGFGCNSLETRRGGGIKRAGTNTVASLGEYIELSTPFTNEPSRGILGPQDEAGSCYGDSGGPMFRYDDAENSLVGITHAGGTSSSDIVSQYINLNRTDIQDFIHSVDNEYNLGIYDYCNAADPLDGPPCRNQAASMHIVAEIQSIFTKLFGWIKGLFLTIF